MREDSVIMFLDDDPHRAALMFNRMNEQDRSRTFWVKTAQEAIDMLRDYRERLEYVFLDHDLGGETHVYSGREDCGMEVIRYLEHQNPTDFDCTFIIHSWNIDAAIKMTERLVAKGYTATQQPFGS
jgi:hypothetical protein